MESWELQLCSSAQVKEPRHDPRGHTNPLVLVGKPGYFTVFELPHFSLCNGTIVRVAHYLGFCIAESEHLCIIGILLALLLLITLHNQLDQ